MFHSIWDQYRSATKSITQLCCLIIALDTLLIHAGSYPTPNNQYGGCFNQKPNTGLNCASAYKTASYGNVQGCLAQCQTYPNCKSAVFTTTTGQCQMFQMAPVDFRRGRRQTGQQIVQQDHNIRYSHRGHRGSGYNKGGYGRGSACGYRGPQTVPTQGSSYYRWNGNCGRGTPAPPLTPLPTIYPQTPIFTPVRPPDTTIRFRPTTTTTLAPETPPLPATVVCPPDEEARFLKIQNIEMIGNDDLSFAASGEQECLTACAQNEAPTGEVTPCLSMEFDTNSNQCTLSLESLPPSGAGSPQETSGMNYYEKTCLPKDLVAGCNEVFDQIPQSILVGHAKAVASTQSYSDCIVEALRSEDTYGFRAISGQYYFNVETFNCILNEQSKDTFPQLMTRAEDEVVNYFDFKCARFLARVAADLPQHGSLEMINGTRTVVPKAVNSVIVLGSNTWGSWTPCNSKTQKKMRFKKCKTLNPSTCFAEERFC